MEVAPIGLGHDDTIASATQLVVPVAEMGGSSSAAAILGESSTPLSAEGGRDVVEEYGSEFDLDPDDVLMFREGFTNSSMHSEGRSRFIEVPTELDLLLQGNRLVSLFEVLCSKAENASLRDVTDIGLMNEVVVMGPRVSIMTLVHFFLP